MFETGWETGLSFLEYTAPPVEAGAPGDDGGTSDDAGGASGASDAAAPSFAWFPPAPGEFYFGGGGGVSILFPQPSYQVGIVPPALADQPGVAARVIPDVSMVADPVTGLVIGQTQPGGTYQEFVVGGTSLSSPLFAGVMALAQQHARRSFGFANTLLYKASRKGAFTDVLPLASPQAVALQPGIVTTFDLETTTIHVTPGYDDVTGLGSPNGASFLANVK